MKHRVGWLVGASLLGAWLAMSAPRLAAAEEPAPARTTYAQGAAHKLGRGLCNILTCPLELARVSALTGRRQGYLAASTSGLAKGLVQMGTRGIGGVVELVTFFVESPANFAPIVHPEFVWADGDWAE